MLNKYSSIVQPKPHSYKQYFIWCPLSVVRKINFLNSVTYA